MALMSRAAKLNEGKGREQNEDPGTRREQDELMRPRWRETRGKKGEGRGGEEWTDAVDREDDEKGRSTFWGRLRIASCFRWCLLFLPFWSSEFRFDSILRSVSLGFAMVSIVYSQPLYTTTTTRDTTRCSGSGGVLLES